MSRKAEFEPDLHNASQSATPWANDLWNRTNQSWNQVWNDKGSADDYILLAEVGAGAIAVLGVGKGALSAGRLLSSSLEASATAKTEAKIAKALDGITLNPGINDVELPVFSQGKLRTATLHTGPEFDPAKDHHLLLTMDGFTMGPVWGNKVGRGMFGQRIPLTGMSEINGLNGMVNENSGQIVALHLLPESRPVVPGLFNVNAWRSPGAGVFTPGKFPMPMGADDSIYAADAVATLAPKMPGGIKSFNLVAYGEGAEVAPNVLSKLAGDTRFAGIRVKSATLNGGTTFGTELAPPSTLQDVLLVRGKLDPNFPELGAGPNTKPLTWLGHTRVDQSRPGNLEAIYKNALGINSEAVTTGISDQVDGAVIGTQRVYAGADGRQLIAREYNMGSTWPGRQFGGDSESIVSKINGPRSGVRLNDEIAKLILRKQIPIERDLVSHT